MSEEPRRMIIAEFDADMLPEIAIMEYQTKYGLRHEEITCNPSRAYDTIFYHSTGDGPASGEPYAIHQTFQYGQPAKHYYWGAPGVVFDVRSQTAERLDNLPAAFPESVFLEGLKNDTETIYCSVCDDAYPDEGYTPCAHLKWCDECGTYHGAGSDEPMCIEEEVLSE